MKLDHTPIKNQRRIHQITMLAMIVLMLASSLPARTGARADEIEPASAGDLDMTFGIGGKVTIDFVGGSDAARAVFVQPDGKIFVAALVTNAARSSVGYGLVRLNKDGSLDTSFGNGGKVGPLLLGDPAACAMQADTKVVIGGSGFRLTRFNPDGSMDNSFGTRGTSVSAFPALGSTAYVLAFYPDGRIVAGGAVKMNATLPSDFALARYNSNGTLDTSFGDGGRVNTDFSGNWDTIYGIVVQPDGRIVVAGDSYKLVGTQNVHDFILVRYNIDGSLDQTFGIGGQVTTEFAGQEVARALILQGDGRLVAAGLTWGPGATGNDIAMARYNTSGSLDSAFGTAGKVISSFGNFNVEASALVAQPDGRLIQAGFADTSGGDFEVARYNSDGSLDASFGHGGSLTTDFGGQFDAARSIVIQPDGNILVAGATDLTSPASDIALARYKGNGPDFALGFDAPSTSAERGTKVKVTVRISREPGFTGNITVTAADIEGVKITPSSGVVDGDSIKFKLKVKGSALLGDHELVFTGQDATGRVRTARLVLAIH